MRERLATINSAMPPRLPSRTFSSRCSCRLASWLGCGAIRRRREYETLSHATRVGAVLSDGCDSAALGLVIFAENRARDIRLTVVVAACAAVAELFERLARRRNRTLLRQFGDRDSCHAGFTLAYWSDGGVRVRALSV